MKGKKATTQSSSHVKSRQSVEEINENNQLSINGFWNHYSKTTDTHTKIIDLFIVYLIAIIGCQFFYRLVVGNDFPRNTFVSGLFCPLGVIVLLVILRGRGRDLRQLAEFFIACIVLFLTAINFAG